MNTATRTARCRGLTLMLLGGGSRRGRRRGASGTGDLRRQERPDRLPALHGRTGEREDLLDVAERSVRAHRLTAGPGASFNPDFSPNGSQLAFERRYGDGRPDAIFTVKSSGGRAAKISSGCTGQCLGDAQPAWSPDGRQILFMRALGPVVHDDAAELDLMVMNRDGSGQRLIRRFGRVVDGLEPGAEGKAEFSPDGRQIALTLVTLGGRPSACRLRGLRDERRRQRPASDHAGQASRRQPGLVAERQVARLPLQQLTSLSGLRSGS